MNPADSATAPRLGSTVAAIEPGPDGMNDNRRVEDEVEGAANIVGPVSTAVLAAALDVAETLVVETVEGLEAAGRVVATRHGVTADGTTLSATRLTHLAGQLVAALVAHGAPLATVARARWAAGDPRTAHQDFLVALEDDSLPADERLTILGHAVESGREARVPAADLAPLLVVRARLLRTRGEHDAAVADLEAATPHLAGEKLVDALGFAAALHDDGQRPADAERTAAMALSVAAREGLAAKVGSLLTFQGRVLARLGFDAETDRVFALGKQLIDAHGTDVQRHYATINEALTDLDRGWVGRAESKYTAARGRAAQLEDAVAVADLDIAIARAKFAAGDAKGARVLLAAARRTAETTDAPVVEFLATLAEAEGAIAFHQPVAAVDAASRLAAIVDGSFPAWRNRAATVEARALLLASRPEEARQAIRRGFETTPRGANGLRLRTELEALQLVAAERWDEETAADVADRLLQGGWLLAAVALLTERARRERRPEFGKSAAALAHRIGAVPAAADAIEAAGLWNDAVSGPIRLAMQRVAHNVPPEWEERWRAVPAVDHALRLDAVAVAAGDSELLEHLDRVLEEAGLGGREIVLSPAQRRSAGLVRSGSAVLSMGRFIAWVTAAAVIAAVVAVALRPEPVEVPVVGAPTATVPTTTTIPPLLERVVETGSDISAQAPFAGGDTRNAVSDVALGEPEGIYWRRQVTGFMRSDPVLRGRSLFLADSEGFVYGIDLSRQGSTIFESRMAGGVDVSPAVEQVVFGQDGQGKVLMFTGDERGNLLVRHVNDTEGEVWRADLGSPITGPPLVRPESMIVATEAGVLYDFLPSDGTELRRFPAEGEIEGGFVDALAAADGVIYARTGTGAVIVIDEASFTEVCSVFSPAALATTHPVVADGQWFVGTSGRSVRVFGAGGCSSSGVGSLQIDTPVEFAPVVADGVLWAPADAVLLPLDVATGQSVGFVVSPGGTFTTPPIVAGGLILVATDGGELIAISRADGTEEWRLALGTVLRSRPLVGNGLIVISTSRGELFAIAAPVD